MMGALGSFLGAVSIWRYLRWRGMMKETPRLPAPRDNVVLAAEENGTRASETRVRVGGGVAADGGDDLATMLEELRANHRKSWLVLSDASGASVIWRRVVRFLEDRRVPMGCGTLVTSGAPRASAEEASPPPTQRARLLQLLLTFLRGHVAGGLEVKPSTIPAAGRGLFATKDFAAGELLCVYSGTRISLTEAMRRTETGTHGDYVMGGFGLKWRVDAGPHPEVLARYVNDHYRQPDLNNAKFDKLRHHCVALVVATRPIAAGEEIFASYGSSYWAKRAGGQ